MPLDLEKISDSPHLLDILLQMEDVLDSLDIYVFKNWYLGEIAEGPKVRRYWLDFTLKYPLEKMPDPKAALRLMKHGVRVDFWKAKLDDKGEDYIDADEEETVAEDEGEGVAGQINKQDTVWLVRISIPRRLVAQMSAEEMDFYDEEVDVEDVEDAKDTGIDDESAFMSDEQSGEQGPPGADQGMGGDDMGMGGPPPGGQEQPR